MEPVKVGVIGVGSLGQHHARIYAEMENAQLVGVVDRREDRAREVAEKSGCAAYNDWRSLFDDVEAVSIAVPTSDHASVGIEALDAGVHVLVEKPIAADLRDADRLIERAHLRGRTLHVGHSERFNPVVQAVRPYISRPQFFEAHRLGVFVQRSLDVDVVLDLMIHDIDLVLWLVASPVVEIKSVGIPVLTPRVDIANARIEFEDGTVANLTASRVSRERVRKLRFFQPNDYLSLDFHQRTAEVYSLLNEDGGRRIVERRPEVTSTEPLRGELEAFLAAVRDGSADSACTGEAGRDALDVALKVLQDGRGARMPAF